MESILPFLVEETLYLCELRPLNKQSLELWGQETTPVSSLNSKPLKSWPWEKKDKNGHRFRKYTLLWRTLLQPLKCFLQAGTTVQFLRYLTVDTGHLFRVTRNMINFLSMSWLPYFNCWNTSSMVRNNSVWNNMTVKKTFCGIMVGGFGRSNMVREGKSFSE